MSEFSTWAKIQIQGINQSILLGQFDLARQKINELEKKGFYWVPKKDTSPETFLTDLLDERTAEVLYGHGIYTCRHLLQKSREELLAIHTLGEFTVDRVIVMMKEIFENKLPETRCYPNNAFVNSWNE